MVDRGADIDIVFRNGLKDFEVLPPADIWDNIQPVIRRKQGVMRFLSVAAMVVVIVTLGILISMMTRKIATEPGSLITAFNVQAAYPIVKQDIVKSYSDVTEISPVLPDAPYQIVNYLEESDKDLYNELNLLTINIPSADYISLVQDRTGELKNRPEALFTPDISNNLQFDESDEIDLYESNIVNESERWSIAAMASPTYYTRYNPGNDDLTRMLMESEKAVVSYTGGVSFSYKINKRFSIQSGLYYSSLGQEVDGINSYGGFKKYDDSKGDNNFKVLTTNGTVLTNNSDVFLIASGSADRVLTNYNRDVFDPGKANLSYINNTMRQNFSYLELPVSIRYKIIDKALDINLIGGVSYNFLVNNSVYTILDGDKYPIGETGGLNPLSLSSTFGMGMEYRVSGSFSVNVEPTFRYYLNAFNPAVSSGVHPYSFGIFSGLSYKF
jgi:hypothetical protein